MLTIGVVGCGDVATRAYLPGIKQLEDKGRLVACFDTVAARAEAAAAMFPGATAYTSYDDFLAHRASAGPGCATRCSASTSSSASTRSCG